MRYQLTPQRLTAALAVALFVSLAGNLFFVGKMLGRAHDGGWGHEWEQGRGQRGGRLAEKLPEADRAVLKATMEKKRAEFDTLKKQMQRKRLAVRAALRSGDHDALDAALRSELQSKGAFFRLLQDIHKEAAESFSPEGHAVMDQGRKEAAARMLAPDALDDKPEQPE